MTPIIAKAREVIQQEAGCIQEMAGFLSDSFEKAVKTVSTCKGRLVISGIGKSALVAQKIVATLNSTGTPALFMHAGDAIHGDLGMIQRDDVVMIISKSGESPEIKVLVPLIKHFGNVLIGMVGNTQSFLAANCDMVLNTTVKQEACINNLAPTTSTTAQMVMGDALAICLMELSGFTGQDFAKYHPGGNLGKRLYLRVADIYRNNAKPAVVTGASLKEVIVTISKSRLGAAVVVSDEGQVLGIITDGDVRRMLEHVDNLTGIKAGDMQHNKPVTIAPDMLAVEALDVLRRHDISQLVVTDDNNGYLGILHLHDLVREGII
ncbi:KpsF/GutQ family sugar-phosphate isomerase [Deminuibacter soli]|uniref:KpsF/GutQ family sugar-phosphate isomerase n=1 Tax=Deminuibacter soli TaxID=2291815 RepID=A0A3E1NQX5_9BACT|nr:KpsF/GutQ family sugar-phosphate isomerase [Deminuibacter soli]RFM30307.1 KpsF/GutQ family sugar-phosphate isomerase [Deminuibacter soli]